MGAIPQKVTIELPLPQEKQHKFFKAKKPGDKIKHIGYGGARG